FSPLFSPSHFFFNIDFQDGMMIRLLLLIPLLANFAHGYTAREVLQLLKDGEGKSLEVKAVNSLLDVVYDAHPSYFESAEELEPLRAETQQRINQGEKDPSRFPIINKFYAKFEEYMASLKGTVTEEESTFLVEIMTSPVFLYCAIIFRFLMIDKGLDTLFSAHYIIYL
ncbi:hypothetical protein PENTCL1PPCAC_29254, partial [Pristionchus entomophagus]